MSAYTPLATIFPDVLITQPFAYKTLIDEASPTITYIGKAIPGSDTAEGVWQIQRLTSSSGDLSVEFADGGLFTQVWDNRAGLSYS